VDGALVDSLEEIDFVQRIESSDSRLSLRECCATFAERKATLIEIRLVRIGVILYRNEEKIKLTARWKENRREPPGGCHFPLVGWAEFASDAKNEIALEFDQAVVWHDSLINEFYLDDAKQKVASGATSGNVVTLKLKEATSAQKITYLKELSWSQSRLLKGKNGLAALTFCDVPILPKN
jgi:hypothetical protein